MPSGLIGFNSENISFSLPGKQQIRRWLSGVLLKEGFSFQSINFIFCTDHFLLKLNRQFLGHDSLTDILTFDYTSENTPEELSGEIFISVDRVKENAKIFGVTFDEEIQRVMVHGVLHLCGYSDKTQKEKKQMRINENKYLTLFKTLQL